jgi:hypothetical protein
LSPEAVTFTDARGTAAGVSFSWLAPAKDARGKPLKSLSGYVVYRKELEKLSDTVNEAIEFEEIQNLTDESLQRLFEKQEAAAKELKPAQSVKLSSEERTVSYIDTSPVSGHTYLYKIVPYNKRGVDGGLKQLYRVVFTGETSVVTVVPADSLNTDDSADDTTATGSAFGSNF